jgi:ABC-type branched-subunit amino acid transport system substrate-binding protein
VSRRGGLAWAALVALAVVLPGSALAAPPRGGPRTVAQAESLLGAQPSRANARALSDWAKQAALDDLLWLLRLPPAVTREAELALVDAALARAPAGRGQLRQRLLARRAAAAAPRRGEPPLPRLDELRPWASVFRLASLLPDSGDYAGHTRILRAALAAGLQWRRAPGARPLVLDTLGTGDSDPARLAAAFEEVTARSDLVFGELLSVPTQALATAATSRGVVLVSPTATDERIGRIGTRVFQVGPGAEARARALAAVVLGRAARRVAILGSAAGVRGPFADAFAAEVTARGGRIVRREPARRLGTEAVRQAASIRAGGVEVVFFDGAARDAETLVRALAGEGASVRVCGGPELAPEGMRPPARGLFEGVTWVAEDWRLEPEARTHADSLAARAGLRMGSLWTRGFLAGRLVAGAVDGGARTPNELARALRAADPVLAAGNVLDAPGAGATLPVYVVRNGRATEAEPGQ